MDIEERLRQHLNCVPDTDQAAFVAGNATLVGDVVLGKDSSVWYGCVLRGDIQVIRIGVGTNVQDGTVVHLADDYGVEVGDYTTIGHMAMIHACKIGHECLIGMNATILDGAEIGDRCIIGAGALVTKNSRIPPGSMVLGSPGKIVKTLSPEEQSALRPWAEKYIHVARAHARLHKSGQV